MPAPTISRKPLLALVAYCADVTLGEIDALFTGNGLIHLNEHFELSRVGLDGGQRRHRAAEYLSAIDMTDETQRTRLLHVFDDLLAKDANGEWQEKEQKEIKRLLKRDGVRFEDGEIANDQLQLPDKARGRFESALPDFSSITDVEVLREHAERMQRASLNADAPDAILAARELLESVCKLICEYYFVTVPKNPNAGQLYKLAAKAIGLRRGGRARQRPRRCRVPQGSERIGSAPGRTHREERAVKVVQK